MSEQDLVNKYPLPVTKQDLIHDLKAIGLQAGDHVLVHSSLSSIGWVVGKEIAVIEALLEVVGKEGTIFMPSQSGDWSNPDGWGNPPVPDNWKQIIKDHMPSFDPKTTPTRAMGRIADAFYHYPGSIRSNHPHVSFSGNGRLAHEILDDHPLEYGLSMDSPLGKMYKHQIKILLIGVDYGNCTALHLSEILADKAEKSKQGAKIDGRWIEFNEYEYNDEDFSKLGIDYEKENQVNHYHIGNAVGRMLKMQSIVNYGIEWLKLNR